MPPLFGSMTGSVNSGSTLSAALVAVGALAGAIAGSTAFTALGSTPDAMGGTTAGATSFVADMNGLMAASTSGQTDFFPTVNGIGLLRGSTAGASVLSGSPVYSVNISGKTIGSSAVTGAVHGSAALAGAEVGASSFVSRLRGIGLTTGSAAGATALTLTGTLQGNLAGPTHGATVLVIGLGGLKPLVGVLAGQTALTARIGSNGALAGAYSGSTACAVSKLQRGTTAGATSFVANLAVISNIFGGTQGYSILTLGNQSINGQTFALAEYQLVEYTWLANVWRKYQTLSGDWAWYPYIVNLPCFPHTSPNVSRPEPAGLYKEEGVFQYNRLKYPTLANIRENDFIELFAPGGASLNPDNSLWFTVRGVALNRGNNAERSPNFGMVYLNPSPAPPMVQTTVGVLVGRYFGVTSLTGNLI